MRIAVANDNNNVSGHFGHCESFVIVNVNGNEVVAKEVVENPGHKPGFLPKFLKEQNVNMIVAGGMGAKAQQLFAADDIEVVVGVAGNIDLAVEGILAGSIKSTKSVCNNHEHQGSCGEH